jgi:spermidine synthase
MTPWVLLEQAQVPGNGGELRLYRRNDEFSIKIAGRGELMNSRVHGSEDALAEHTCARLAGCPQPRLLIGGLGMGFTLAAALRHLGDQAQVVVAELVPAVVAWNRGALGEPAGHPLRDPRVSVRETDVGRLLVAGEQAYDAILLDVDNGPEGLTRKENDWLYGVDGLNAAYAALRPGGVLAVWSAGPAREFAQRLRKVGLEVEEVRVRAHGSKGARHIIWFATRVE